MPRFPETKSPSGLGKRLVWCFFLILLSLELLSSSTAWSYFVGQATSDNTEVKDKPDNQSITSRTLPKGSLFYSSDTLVNGYFRIKIANQLGWIKKESVSRRDTQKKIRSKKSTKSTDDLLSNNSLKAFSGSTSRWSISSNTSYLGGPISSPLSQDRPDISGSSATTIKSQLNSAISLKYNLDASNSLQAGTGLRWIAPFQSVNDYDGTRFDLANPFITFQHIDNIKNVQEVLQFQMLQWTQSDTIILGYSQQLSMDLETVYEIKKTGISIGLSTNIIYIFFNKSEGDSSPDIPGSSLGQEQSQLQIFLSPYEEYQMTDKVNLRLYTGLVSLEHYRYQKNFSFTHDKIYQSIGFGLAVSRDIYLFPNLQFLPSQIRASLTNFGFNATINLF